jgi:sulfite exporter TauE/SafE
VTALFIGALMLGLATSVHCISMCGPMVVTYAVKSEDGDSWQKKVLPNVAYQGAKLASYVLVGLLLGAIGSAFNLNGIRPWVMLVAGAFMLVLGLGMTGKVPWAARLTPRPPRALINALSKLRRKANTDAEAGESSIVTPIAFGLLTGLMPCAPLQAAELNAASAGGVLQGAIAMLAFGLGTMPLLFAFGTASSLIPVRWKHRLTFVLAFVVMGLGLVFLNRSAMLLGFPVNANTIKTAVVGAPPASSAASFKTASDGVAEVNLTVANGGYSPSALNIPADKPVRLIVNRPESDSCSSQLAFPQLGILKDLKANGTTVVDLPATKAGSYTMTCGMGMLSGQLVAGAGGAAGSAPVGSGESPALWLVFTILAGAGALYAARGIKPAAAPAQASGTSSNHRAASTPKRKPAANRSRG